MLAFDNTLDSSAQSTFRSLGKVARRARERKQYTWAILIVVGCGLLGGMDIMSPSGNAPKLELKCGKLVLASRAHLYHCPPPPIPKTSALGTYAGHLPIGTTVISLSGRIPLAWSTGDHVWFWEATMGLALSLAILLRMRRFAAPNRHIYLWYLAAGIAYDASLFALRHVNWSIHAIGIFSIACGLIVLSVGEGSRILFGASLVLFTISVWINNPMFVQANSSLLLPSSIIEAILGVSLIVAGFVIRLRRTRLSVLQVIADD